jgi:hypothetical protein
MSSGKIVQNYSKLVQESLLFNESVIFSEDNLQISHQFESEPYKEGSNRDLNLSLEELSNRVNHNNLETIKKIHYILKNTQGLTLKQKYDYCSSQRFYMKLYLKSVSERI